MFVSNSLMLEERLPSNSTEFYLIRFNIIKVLNYQIY